MPSLIPVYTDLNGIHDITLFSETPEGTFRMTPSRPLRQLRHNILGVSQPVGELVSRKYDRHPRDWATATVTVYGGRPQSLYHFLRDKTHHKKTIVATLPTLHGRVTKVHLHELIFRPSMSPGSWSLFMAKYVESLDLWREPPATAHAEPHPTLRHLAGVRHAV